MQKHGQLVLSTCKVQTKRCLWIERQRYWKRISSLLERNEWKSLPFSVWDCVRKWGQLQPDLVNVLTNDACRMQMYHFTKRNNLSRRKVTHQAQKNPSLQSDIEDFVQYIQIWMRMLSIPRRMCGMLRRPTFSLPPNQNGQLQIKEVGQSPAGNWNWVLELL